MYGARCPGRPGAPGDSGNWSACNGTLDLATGTLAARFDFNPPHGFIDTGLLKPNTSGGPPALSWKAAGLWLPGPAVHPPLPPPLPPHGTRSRWSTGAWGRPSFGAVISFGNRTSDFKFKFNSAHLAAWLE